MVEYINNGPSTKPNLLHYISFIQGLPLYFFAFRPVCRKALAGAGAAEEGGGKKKGHKENDGRSRREVQVVGEDEAAGAAANARGQGEEEHAPVIFAEAVARCSGDDQERRGEDNAHQLYRNHHRERHGRQQAVVKGLDRKAAGQGGLFIEGYGQQLFEEEGDEEQHRCRHRGQQAQVGG